MAADEEQAELLADILGTFKCDNYCNELYPIEELIETRRNGSTFVCPFKHDQDDDEDEELRSIPSHACVAHLMK